MRDPSTASNEPLFWEHERNRAVRDGKWKLVSRHKDIHEQMSRVGTGHRTGEWELYDLSTDRNELRNLAAASKPTIELVPLTDDALLTKETPALKPGLPKTTPRELSSVLSAERGLDGGPGTPGDAGSPSKSMVVPAARSASRSNSHKVRCM
jgi:hypothetical protein